MEKRHRPIVETQIQLAAVSRFFTILQIMGAQEFVFPSFVYCVDFEKAYYCVPPGVLWEFSWRTGYQGYIWIIWYMEQGGCLYSWHQVAVVLRQGCSIFPLLFVIFIDVACSITRSGVIPDRRGSISAAFTLYCLALWEYHLRFGWGMLLNIKDTFGCVFVGDAKVCKSKVFMCILCV